jgi:hypothetical protein
MQSSHLADLEAWHKPAPPLGSLVDLISRAQGRPIYCTASFAVRRALMNVVLGSLSRDFPSAAYIDALTIYRNYNDWSRRWSSEHERYGAGIVVTRGEALPDTTDPFGGLAGEHVIGSRVAVEIETLVRHGRPVAWHAVVFPATYWLSRFAIQPFVRISRSRYASVSPVLTAEHFHPLIGPSFVRVVGA